MFAKYSAAAFATAETKAEPLWIAVVVVKSSEGATTVEIALACLEPTEPTLESADTIAVDVTFTIPAADTLEAAVIKAEPTASTIPTTAMFAMAATTAVPTTFALPVADTLAIAATEASPAAAGSNEPVATMPVDAFTEDAATALL